LWRIWFELGASQQYDPILHSAFWVEHRLWGDAVLGYHLTNVGLHALAAFLFVVLLRRLEVRGAWLSGWAFALHPVGRICGLTARGVRLSRRWVPHDCGCGMRRRWACSCSRC
jgi:hypothetical protein